MGKIKSQDINKTREINTSELKAPHYCTHVSWNCLSNLLYNFVSPNFSTSSYLKVFILAISICFCKPGNLLEGFGNLIIKNFLGQAQLFLLAFLSDYSIWLSELPGTFNHNSKWKFVLYAGGYSIIISFLRTSLQWIKH